MMNHSALHTVIKEFAAQYCKHICLHKNCSLLFPSEAANTHGHAPYVSKLAVLGNFY